MNDGKVQLSFTLPIDDDEKAIVAARVLAEKMGIKDPDIVYHSQLDQGFTFFIVYGSVIHSVDYTKIKVDTVEIEVMTMEEINESPKFETDQRILGRLAMNEALTPFYANNSIGGLKVRVIGWSERLRGAINRCGNRNPRSLQIIQESLAFDELDATGPETLYFYDSGSFKDPQGILAELKKTGAHLFDLVDFERRHGQAAVDAPLRRPAQPGRTGQAAVPLTGC